MMSEPRHFQVAKIAGLLFGISSAETYLFGPDSSISTEQAAVQLFKAASLIQNAEEMIHGPLAVITATLAGATQSTSMLNMDSTGPSGSTPYLLGQATSSLTGNHSGRFLMNASYYPDNYNPTIPDSGVINVNRYNSNYSISAVINNTTSNSTTNSTAMVPLGPMASASTAGTYWVLAAEGNSSTGYDAALVYGCQVQPYGGVKQPLFILSRKPYLDQNTTNKFMSITNNLGIDQECAEPFVFTVHDGSCVYPPAYY